MILVAGDFADNTIPVLAGVLVGWLLGEGTRVWQDRRTIRRLQKALIAECRSILKQLPQLKDIIDQAVSALRNHRVLPAEHVHTPRLVYTAAIIQLTPRLELAERNLLHVAYEHLRVADEFLDGFDREFLADLKEGVVDDPWVAIREQAG